MKKKTSIPTLDELPGSGSSQDVPSSTPVERQEGRAPSEELSDDSTPDTTPRATSPASPEDSRDPDAINLGDPVYGFGDFWSFVDDLLSEMRKEARALHGDDADAFGAFLDK